MEAVRELLATFPNPENTSVTNDAVVPEHEILSDLMANPTGLSQYISVALIAATIRWASHETGQPEETILSELASNYT